MSERRALSKDFKERRMVGGIYLIRNTQSGRYLLGHTLDLASARHRFQFSVTTGSTIDPRVRADWAALGPHAFAFEVLEELEQGPDQTRAQFDADLVELAELRRAELDPAQAY
jgi:hypothetical protein